MLLGRAASYLVAGFNNFEYGSSRKQRHCHPHQASETRSWSRTASATSSAAKVSNVLMGAPRRDLQGRGRTDRRMDGSKAPMRRQPAGSSSGTSGAAKSVTATEGKDDGAMQGHPDLEEPAGRQAAARLTNV